MLKRPDPSSSVDTKKPDTKKPSKAAKPKPGKAPKKEVEEQEVAEALFDLANLAALAGGEDAQPKRKKMRTKKEVETKTTENDAAGGVAAPMPGAMPPGFPANINPLQALFSNPAAAAAMANIYGGGMAQAQGGGMTPGWPPGFDISQMAAAMGGGMPNMGAPMPPAMPAAPAPSGARPPGALKLCAAHVYIAHFIDYQQQMSRYSVMQKQMDPGLGNGQTQRGGEAGLNMPGTAEPAPAVGFGNGRSAWPMPGGMPQGGMPGGMFPPGPTPQGMSADFQQASQFAALQALMGNGAAGGMPFGFPNGAVNPFGGMMPPGMGGEMNAQGMGEMPSGMPQMQVPFFTQTGGPAMPWMGAPAGETEAPTTTAAAPADETGATPVAEGTENDAVDAVAAAKPAPEVNSTDTDVPAEPLVTEKETQNEPAAIKPPAETPAVPTPA